MAEGVPADTETVTDDVPEISPDEALYRRCVPGWFRQRDNRPSVNDFMPRAWVSEERPGDIDGLSVTRRLLTTLEQAATCPITGRKFHVAQIMVEFVESLDLSVESRPVAHDRGHSIIPELNSLDRRYQDGEVWMQERAKQLRDNAEIVFVST